MFRPFARPDVESLRYSPEATRKARKSGERLRLRKQPRHAFPDECPSRWFGWFENKKSRARWTGFPVPPRAARHLALNPIRALIVPGDMRAGNRFP